jgi:hypothetical protein
MKLPTAFFAVYVYRISLNVCDVYEEVYVWPGVYLIIG